MRNPSQDIAGIDAANQQYSPETAYLRYGTSIEQDDVLIDKKFIKQFAARYLQSNKFPALSNSNPRQVQIERIRSMKIDLLMDCGLVEDAITVGWDSVRDHQNFRGLEGFFQKAQITQRHEIKEDAPKEKMGRFSTLLRKQEPAEGPSEE